MHDKARLPAEALNVFTAHAEQTETLPKYPARQVQFVDPGGLSECAGQRVHDVAVLVLILYVDTGQLTHESPVRIKPAPHCMTVGPGLNAGAGPGSYGDGAGTVSYGYEVGPGLYAGAGPG